MMNQLSGQNKCASFEINVQYFGQKKIMSQQVGQAPQNNRSQISTQGEVIKNDQNEGQFPLFRIPPQNAPLEYYYSGLEFWRDRLMERKEITTLELMQQLENWLLINWRQYQIFYASEKKNPKINQREEYFAQLSGVIFLFKQVDAAIYIQTERQQGLQPIKLCQTTEISGYNTRSKIVTMLKNIQKQKNAKKQNIFKRLMSAIFGVRAKKYEREEEESQRLLPNMNYHHY